MDEPGGRAIEQRGLYFEEFELGARYLHNPGRTATEADNVLFTTLTMNTQALHLDAAFAATQPFGRPLMGEISFPHPLFAGDTLYTETTPLTARLSASRPGQGIVVLAHTGRNQRGEVVARASRTALVWCIGRGGAST